MNATADVMPVETTRSRLPLSARPIGEILALTAGIAQEKIDEALAAQANRKEEGRLGEILVKLKYATEEQILKAVAIQFDMEFRAKIATEEVDGTIISRWPIMFAKASKILPVKALPDGTILTIVADPTETSALDEARMMLGATFTLALSTTNNVIDAINQSYDRAISTIDIEKDIKATDGMDEVTDDFSTITDIIDSNDDEAPIIRLVNSVLVRAVKERASDIHIEPYERTMMVRYRVDGVLKRVVVPPKKAMNAITSRIKVMGGLNIAEKRLPQDGRIRIKLAGKDIDIRLSTTPTIYGERIVMRLLDKNATLLNLEDIGFDKGQLKIIQSLIDRPHGIILVTGPTGSGKTTTLYAAISRINNPDLNIMTIEDPVEYQLDGISQTPVNAKIDLTFANGLRSFLRQDPDVIMVGEIRDVETAEIAIQASLTGHLVFSTIHTNDSAGSITRLVDMGVEPFLVASSLCAAMAQRLVRKVCKECRVPHTVTREELLSAQVPEERIDLYINGTYFSTNPTGCSNCNGTGYRGRTGIYEIMLVDDAVRALILKNVDSNTIKKEAMRTQSMVLLREDGVKRASQGITCLEEVMRVTEEHFE